MTYIPKKVRQEVLEESGYRCAIPNCGAVIPIDMHHIVQLSEEGGNIPSNLMALCPSCHALHHRGTIPRDSLIKYKNQLRKGKILCNIHIEEHEDSTAQGAYEETFWKDEYDLLFDVLGEQDLINLTFGCTVAIRKPQRIGTELNHNISSCYLINDLESEKRVVDFIEIFQWPNKSNFSVNQSVTLPRLKLGKYQLSIWTHNNNINGGGIAVTYRQCRIELVYN